jgi:hypothetical protein
MKLSFARLLRSLFAGFTAAALLGAVPAAFAAKVIVAGNSKTAAAVVTMNSSTTHIAQNSHSGFVKVNDDAPMRDRNGNEVYKLQRLFSRLGADVNAQNNQQLLKRTAELIIDLQNDPKADVHVVDVLTVPAEGPDGYTRSRDFAERIANSLARFGVKRVYVDGQELSRATRL